MKKTKKAVNGVHMEVHDANKIPREVALHPHTLRRNPAGDWTFTFDVEFVFTLDDGRVIAGERRIAIGRIVQQGRKPRATT